MHHRQEQLKLRQQIGSKRKNAFDRLMQTVKKNK